MSFYDTASDIIIQNQTSFAYFSHFSSNALLLYSGKYLSENKTANPGLECDWPPGWQANGQLNLEM